MGSISVPTAIIGAGALGAGASGLSGILGSSAAQNAAQVQANAAEYAAQLQKQEFQQIRTSLKPYMQLGEKAIAPLERDLGIGGVGAGSRQYGWLNKEVPQWKPTMKQLAATPGYQFALQQGLQATQNSYAAQGLGQSGAALKGAAGYAQGLATTTYQNQYENYIQQQQLNLANRAQVYGQLSGTVGTGLGAATGLGQFGQNAASSIGSNLTSAAAAQAGGIVGSTNAITNALGGVAGAGSSTALLMALNNSGIFGGGGTGAVGSGVGL